MNKNENKNPKHRFTSRIKGWCNELSQRQRLRLILILSTVYFLMAVTVFIWIFLDVSGKKGIEIRHIHAIPMLSKGLRSAVPADSISNHQKQESYGKE
jgi:hypothetical protein